MAAKDGLTKVLTTDMFEAEVVRGLLESNGIPVMVMNNSLSNVLSSYGAQVSIMVNPTDADAARKILSERGNE